MSKRLTNLTILFSSAGRRVELIRCFQEDASALGIPVTVLACDANPDFSPACQITDSSYRVPRCDTPDFIPAMVNICRDHKVDLVIPTIDTELLALSESRAIFGAIGTKLII